MRVLLATTLLFVATASSAADPTPAEVQAGLKKGVVFEVLPDEDGKATSCDFAMTQDGPTNTPDPDFKPSEKYVADACQKLRSRHWSVLRDTAGKIKPVYDYCMWSEVVPDSAICRVVPEQ